MNSRKLQVLGFIKRYYLQTGQSPTQGEIATGLDVSKTRIQALIRQLDREKLIKRVRGRKRGIMLADRAKQVSAIDALLLLKLEGWSVNPGRFELCRPRCRFRVRRCPRSSTISPMSKSGWGMMEVRSASPARDDFARAESERFKHLVLEHDRPPARSAGRGRSKRKIPWSLRPASSVR